MNALNKTLIPFLKGSLNAYTVRQQTIAKNIANVDTPDYNPMRVGFEEQLQRAVKRTAVAGKKSHTNHIDIGSHMLTDRHLEIKAEQNERFSLEGEMAELAKNQIKFEFTSKMLAGAYESIRSSIIGRVR